MINSSNISYLDRNNDSPIAYHATPGKSPGIIFFGGFMSDMSGTKATALEHFAKTEGHACTRFDYSGMASPAENLRWHHYMLAG